MVQITKRRVQNIKSAICTNIKQRVSVSHRTRHFGDKRAKNGPNHNKIVHFGRLGIKCSALQWRRNKGSGSFPMGLSTLATWAKIEKITLQMNKDQTQCNYGSTRSLATWAKVKAPTTITLQNWIYFCPIFVFCNYVFSFVFLYFAFNKLATNWQQWHQQLSISVLFCRSVITDPNYHWCIFVFLYFVFIYFCIVVFCLFVFHVQQNLQYRHQQRAKPSISLLFCSSIITEPNYHWCIFVFCVFYFCISLSCFDNTSSYLFLNSVLFCRSTITTDPNYYRCILVFL